MIDILTSDKELQYLKKSKPLLPSSEMKVIDII